MSRPYLLAVAAATTLLALASPSPAYMSNAAEKKAAPPAPAAAPAAKVNLAEILITVNNDPITRGDVQRVLTIVKNNNPLLFKGTVKSMEEAAARDKLVEMSLLYQAGLKNPPADLADRLEKRLNERKEPFVTTDAYKKALERSGLTESDYSDMLKKELVIDHFITENFASKSPEPTEKEIRAYYDENIEGFKRLEESRHLRHIQIGFKPDAPAAEKEVAYAKAEKVLARLKKGEDFAALAKSESSCPSAAYGGDLSQVKKGQMPESFDKAAFALPSGQISGIVETPIGYHIIRVDEISPAEYAPYDEIKARIAGHLKAQHAKKLLNAWLDDARKNATIKILVP